MTEVVNKELLSIGKTPGTKSTGTLSGGASANHETCDSGGDSSGAR